MISQETIIANYPTYSVDDICKNLSSETKLYISIHNCKNAMGDYAQSRHIDLAKMLMDAEKRAEAEAERAHDIIEAYRELHSISNGQLNEMEKLIKDYEPNREKVARAYELLKKIEALTKYNNPK